jgi:hypothetical protein
MKKKVEDINPGTFLNYYLNIFHRDIAQNQEESESE